MAVIYFLIIISLIFVAGFLIAFFKSLNAGQFDDSQTPAMRILFDDDIKKKDSVFKDN